MKIKVKLTIWVGLLFAMILALAVMSAIYVNRLKDETENALTSNTNSIEYSRKMLESLDRMTLDSINGAKEFNAYLSKQRTNITEVGEQQYSDLVFKQINQVPIGAAEIRHNLNKIMELNMAAIQRKNLHEITTANEATTIIMITGTLCFIIAFILLFNLPSNIADPIKELTESIRQIAAHNYERRIHFSQKNEFGELANSFNIMAEKLEEYSNSSLSNLLIEKKRVETLIDKMQDPVLGLNEDYKIIFINEKALEITMLSSKDILGKDARNIAIENDLVRTMIQGLQTPTSNNTNEKPIKIYAENKESYFEKEIISIDITPTGEQTMRQAGYVIVLRNITPFKELDLAKTNFIANVSHELKTPIASIKMGVKLLESEKENATEFKTLVTGIEEDADRLLKITSELLQMTQVEAGIISVNKSTHKLSEILNYSIDTVKFAAVQKNIQILDHADKELYINADKEKTIWVITNLIGNAIRYSPEHTSVTINAFKNADKVRIEITDDGAGINEEYQNKIFDRYFKIPGNREGGNGLGLNICKEFMQAQGGNIGVLQNDSGVGSTFYVEI